MTILKIGIASYEQMKARTMAIARGELIPSPDDPKIWLPSAESFAGILSEPNRHLLGLIRNKAPESLTELAKLSGREKGNLSRTLRTMERYGFITLKRAERGRVVPHTPYQGVELVVPFSLTP